MKRFIIITLLMLLLLALAVFLMPAAEGQAKTKVPEVSFEEHVKSMIQEHKLMTKRLIAYIEYKHESIDLLARVAFKENWYTDEEKLSARWTMGVVMNRVASPYFPNTVKEVLYQKGQYSTTKYFFTEDPPEECYEMAREVWENGVPEMPENVLFQSQQPKLGRGYWKVINGEYFAYG